VAIRDPMSRRTFVKVSAMAATMALAACAKAPSVAPVTPAAAPTTAAGAAPTVASGAAVPASATPTGATGASGANAPTSVSAGAKSTLYHEAPMLQKMVAGGKLPPVEQRLPAEPYVVTPTSEVGKYGDVLRAFMLNATDTPAPQNACLNYSLVTIPRDIKTFIARQPLEGWVPLLAKDYKWNGDATALTIGLRKGMRWSDGELFTAEDVTWAWQDVRFNTEYQPVPEPWTMVGGKPISLTAPDPYTLAFTFPAPNPTFLYQVRLNNIARTPKHFFTRFHPKYTPAASYKDLQQRLSTDLDPERPFLSPWTVQSNDPAKGVTLTRNPYFAGVDTSGNQLPYADGYSFPVVGTQENAVLKAIAGDIDVAERNMQLIEKVPLLKQNEGTGKYKTLLWHGSAFTQAAFVSFNYILADPANSELRDMLRTPDFRTALSVALDRADLNQTLFLGLGRPTRFGINSSSPYWDKEVEAIVQQNVDRDTDKAKSLLTKLGLVDRTNNGMRQFPSGKPVSIVLDVASEITNHARAGEIVVRNWREIGIDAKLNAIARANLITRQTDYSFHANIWGIDAGDLPLLRPTTELFTMWNITPDYFASAKDPAPDDVAQLFALQKQLLGAADPKESVSLFKQMIKLRVDNTIEAHFIADVPVVVVRSNRVANVPDVGYSLQTYIIENPEQFYLKASG